MPTCWPFYKAAGSVRVEGSATILERPSNKAPGNALLPKKKMMIIGEYHDDLLLLLSSSFDLQSEPDEITISLVLLTLLLLYILLVIHMDRFNLSIFQLDLARISMINRTPGWIVQPRSRIKNTHGSRVSRRDDFQAVVLLFPAWLGTITSTIVRLPCQIGVWNMSTFDIIIAGGSLGSSPQRLSTNDVFALLGASWIDSPQRISRKRWWKSNPPRGSPWK